MELVRVRLVQNDCQECFLDLLKESNSQGGFPLGGEIVEVPGHWLNAVCTHGRSALKFEPVEADPGARPRESERAKSEEIELEPTDPRIDATKNIGYPVREHGPYGSHPMHDDFDDDAGPDGSGTY